MIATLRSVFYLLFSFSILCTGIGVHSTLLGVRASHEHFGALNIGLMMSSYYLGFVFGTRLIEIFIHRVGHIRTFGALVGTLTAVTLLHSLWIHPVPWILLRFVHGSCIAGGYMVLESWLNGLSVKENRGRIMSVYMILNSLGLAAGQLFFNLSDGSDFILFAVAATLTSVSVVPLLLSNTAQPASHPSIGVLPLRTLLKTSPLSVAGALSIGLVNGAFLGLSAPTLLNEGLSAIQASQFIAMSFIGGLLFQWPLGSVSDRINRRLVIMASALIASAMAAAIAYLIHQKEILYPLLLVAGLFYGGFCYPVYSLLIALTNDQLDSHLYVQASRALLSLNGMGAIIGPLIASLAINYYNGTGLYGYISAIFMALGGISLLRLLFGKKLPEQKTNRDAP